MSTLAACGDSGAGDAAADSRGASGDTGTSTDTTTGTDAGGDTAGPAVVRCGTDADCTGTGEVCACTGACVVPTGQACTEDRNCGVPFWCNDCTGHCEGQAELCGSCTQARGCQDDGACLPLASGETVCGRSCITDIGCPTGYACRQVGGVAEKQCVPKSGSCIALGICTEDHECPEGEICNATLGECGAGCADDGSCVLGQVCQAGRCVPPCTGNQDCTAPAECNEEGKCTVPGACESKQDCPDAQTYCDRQAGMCAAGCLVDGDCGDAALACEGGQCVPRGCQHNYQCQFAHECTQASGACEPTPDPHCAACGESAGAVACDDPNICVSFKDEDENPVGDFCLLTCKDDPIDQCPSGYQCQAAEVEGEERFFCFRQCWVDVVAP